MKFLLFLLGVISTLCMDIVIPAYFNPNDDGGKPWDQMAAAASAGTPVTVIMNPSSGPGKVGKNEYTLAITKLRKAGATVVGYVHTSYGRRAFSDVKADIDAYMRFYQIDGFFIDQMSDVDSTEIVNYYRKIYNSVKGLNRRLIVINNHGNIIPQTFLSTRVADRFMVFESSHNAYSTYSQPAWQSNYPPYTWIHCIYDATQSQMKSDVVLANSRKTGGIYVTDRTLNPNPYNGLSSYWDQLVAAVNNVNSSG